MVKVDHIIQTFFHDGDVDEWFEIGESLIASSRVLLTGGSTSGGGSGQVFIPLLAARDWVPPGLEITKGGIPHCRPAFSLLGRFAKFVVVCLIKQGNRCFVLYLLCSGQNYRHCVLTRSPVIGTGPEILEVAGFDDMGRSGVTFAAANLCGKGVVFSAAELVNTFHISFAPIEDRVPHPLS